ncbi:MAG: hypothetical protein IKA61_03280 [Clostridia bacterium]|nr:hypothetical protein [Clostridia bacterium]
MNPFKEKVNAQEDYLQSFKDLYPKAYDKNQVDPYTKTRIILAAGAEWEANWFSHQMHRNISNTDLRRDIALTRFLEKQQQQKLVNLKPVNETVLETTITYEQLAVDLTAEMAQKESDFYVKKALDFALLEDFDHLYRYSNLLDMDYGVHAERLVGGYTEITPARPTVSHHRHPIDNVKRCINGKKASTQTVLNTMIITAAEQQTMNYYMNQSAFYINDLGRKLFEEICLVEEEHVTQYGALIDTSPDWLECNLWHEYTECFVYWSNYMTETDKNIKKIWEHFFEMELSHLHGAVELLKKYSKKDYQEVILDPEFPEPLSLHSNIDYVKDIIANTVQYTGDSEDYKDVCNLEQNARFFTYNPKINCPVKDMASHRVIEDYIKKNGNDYRFETAENPIEALRCRTKDNTEVGFNPDAAKSTKFKQN